jgi:hypothetical protein
MGSSVSVIGDIYGNDGISELIVGEPYVYLDRFNYFTIGACGFWPKGRFVVLNGANGNVIREYAGGDYGYRLGTVVSGLGDVNGDGVPDFAGVGSERSLNQTDPDLVVYSGAGPNYPLLHTRKAAAAGGPSMTGIRFNGYSCNGILFGEPSMSGGQVRLISGACNGFADIGVLHAPTGANMFGLSVAAVGDVNGLGVPDFIVGAPDSTNKGKAYVIAGEDLSVLSTLQSTTSGIDSFGTCVSGVTRNVGGQPYPYYAIGAPNTSGVVNNAGVAYTYGFPPRKSLGWQVVVGMLLDKPTPTPTPTP